MSSSDVAVIVGVGRVGPFAGGSGRTAESLTLESVEAACADAGVATTEVDAVLKYSHDTSLSLQALAATLRCGELRFGLEIGSGGGTASALLDTAKALVVSGAATTVLCHRTIVGQDWVARMNQPDPVRPYYMDTVNYLRAVGWTGYLHTFACMYSEHAARYGTTREALGHVVRQLRDNAGRNPEVPSPGPMSLEEYLAHPPQVGPFTDADDFAMSDVAGAVIVTTAERAAALGAGRPLAEIAAVAQSHNEQPMTWFESRTLASTLDGPVRTVADLLYARSGMTPADIDVAHLYDCTSFSFLHNLEETRLCERGEAAALVAEPDSLSATGRRPANTNGGDLVGGYSHGFSHIVEGALQVTGRAVNQVAGAQTALVMGAQVGPTSGSILRRWDAA